MGKEFSNRTSSSSSFMTGGIFIVIGIVLLFVNGLLGILAVMVGVLLLFFKRNVRYDTTVVCSQNGFTVKVTNKQKSTSVKEYKWEDVASTHYYERYSGIDNETTNSYFKVTTTEGVAFDLWQMKDFDELIQIFNQKTPNLPYHWEKPTGFFASSFTNYKKVGRERT
ncbi:hypothetical protein [Neobacillus vireti]|uniref:YcxB-like protein domain-containing protein n=1 Tax=Neobacillus vireti LMG 21834 TaxID=1131730 RepID=A0AB94IRX9_9BACI|nr:hypothetical protein [Neobacillus vireti]ETI69792.1 hypothetical protein BAVI_05724 [Neobacillus vireti LMG 21834]KLT17852.1 hypothetical protein AA980_12245 [Neobacillus vireti]